LKLYNHLIEINHLFSKKIEWTTENTVVGVRHLIIIQGDIGIEITIKNIEIQEVIEGAIAPEEDIIHLEIIDITIQKGILVRLEVHMDKEIQG